MNNRGVTDEVAGLSLQEMLKPVLQRRIVAILDWQA